MPAGKRKLIGLTGPSSFTQECIEAIEELLDANFVLLYHSSEANLKYWLDEVDGIIVSGGIDVHPTIYSESIWNNTNLSKFDIKRDFRELSMIEYCLVNEKPLIGICRGHQLLGIRHGMGFIMDLASSSICHQPNRANISISKNEPAHTVKFVNDKARELFYNVYKMPETPPERMLLKQVLHERQNERLWVNSFHHQAVAFNPKKDYEAEGVTVIGVSRIDMNACKEIVEFMQGPRWIGVQWHPEYDWRENTASKVVLERFKAMVNGEE